MHIDDQTYTVEGRTYRRVLLRRSYREKGKVKSQTIANLSQCSSEEIDAIKLALKNKKNLGSLQTLSDIQITQDQSIGAVYLLKHLAKRIHIIQALGEDREGKLALWQIMARVIDQGSRLSSTRLAQQHAVCDILDLESFDENNLYENLDWLSEHQERIENTLFEKRYTPTEVPQLYLYDVTSSYLEGEQNYFCEYGYNRDEKEGKPQMVIGLLTDQDGIPLSVEVFEGNTHDTKTVFSQIQKVSKRFGVKHVTFVGDKGMIKTAQIEDLHSGQFHYITAITKPQIRKLLETNVIRMSLFDQTLSEVEKGAIRYILRKNPLVAEGLEKKRGQKKQKVREEVQKENKYLLEHKRAKVKTAQGRVQKKIEQWGISKFVRVEVQEKTLFMVLDEEKEAELSLLDGCYVIKTDLSKEEASAQKVHERYKDLALVEEGFRTFKTGYLEVRPVFVRKETRTRGHVLVVMLAYLLVQELRKCWASINLTVEEGIAELSNFIRLKIQVDQSVHYQIPHPSDLSEDLFECVGVTPPTRIPTKHVKVTTRKSLVSERKCRRDA